MSVQLPTYWNHRDMRALRKAVAKDRNQQLVALVFVLLSGIALIIMLAHRHAVFSILGAAASVLAFRALYPWFGRLVIHKTPLFNLLLNQPRKIVWVYSVVTQRMPFGFEFSRNGLLYFKLIDGDQIVVSLPEDKLVSVANFLQRLLPHASFGYTADREQWYIAAPELLIQHDEGNSSE